MTVVGQSFAVPAWTADVAVRGARLLAEVQQVRVGRVLHIEQLAMESQSPGVALYLFEVVLEENPEDGWLHEEHMAGRERESVQDCPACERAYEAQYR